MVLGDGRDRLSRQDDRPFRDGRAKHAARARREHRPLLRLLRDHVAIRAHGVEGALRDVERRLRRVDLHLGVDAAPLELDCPIVVALRLIALGLLRIDAGVERLPLQDEFLVRHHRDLGAGGDAIALLDGERHDRPADPRPGGELVDRLDRRDDRLLVGDARHMNNEAFGDHWKWGRDRGGEHKGKAHQGVLRTALDPYIRLD